MTSAPKNKHCDPSWVAYHRRLSVERVQAAVKLLGLDVEVEPKGAGTPTDAFAAIGKRSFEDEAHPLYSPLVVICDSAYDGEVNERRPDIDQGAAQYIDQSDGTLLPLAVAIAFVDELRTNGKL